MLSSEIFKLFPSLSEANPPCISCRLSADTEILRMRLTVLQRISADVFCSRIDNIDDCFLVAKGE